MINKRLNCTKRSIRPRLLGSQNAGDSAMLAGFCKHAHVISFRDLTSVIITQHNLPTRTLQSVYVLKSSSLNPESWHSEASAKQYAIRSTTTSIGIKLISAGINLASKPGLCYTAASLLQPEQHWLSLRAGHILHTGDLPGCAAARGGQYGRQAAPQPCARIQGGRPLERAQFSRAQRAQASKPCSCRWPPYAAAACSTPGAWTCSSVIDLAHFPGDAVGQDE